MNTDMAKRVQKELAVLRRMFADTDRKRKPDGWGRDCSRKGELAALQDGPNDGSWWWRTELENRQASCWAVHRDWRTVAPDPICGYRPTEQWAPHPAEIQPETRAPVQGRVWSWSDPASAAAS